MQGIIKGYVRDSIVTMETDMNKRMEQRVGLPGGL